MPPEQGHTRTDLCTEQHCRPKYISAQRRPESAYALLSSLLLSLSLSIYIYIMFETNSSFTLLVMWTPVALFISTFFFSLEICVQITNGCWYIRYYIQIYHCSQTLKKVHRIASSVMVLGSLQVSGLPTSYLFSQVTLPKLLFQPAILQ